MPDLECNAISKAEARIVKVCANPSAGLNGFNLYCLQEEVNPLSGKVTRLEIKAFTYR